MIQVGKTVEIVMELEKKMCKLQCVEICALLKKVMVWVKINENLNRAQKSPTVIFFHKV